MCRSREALCDKRVWRTGGVLIKNHQGWNDVSFHGSKEIPTPNLDALAYDGIILANYYVQPLCTPTRAALMTGRYPLRVGLQHDVLMSAQPYGLLLNETIMPQYLKQLGYSTHIVGKWHLGFFADQYIPTRRGFDSHYGYYSGCEDYLDHTYAGNGLDQKAWGLDFHRNEEVEKTAFGQYSTEIFTKQAENIIASHDTSKPLYLYVAQQAVHSGNQITPLEAPWKYLKKMAHIKDKNRHLYAGMVSALDDSVRNITKALHDRGMLNNTILVFSTDNGGPANGFNRNDANNWPLRGLKATLWEGGVHGTGFIWSPLLKKSGYTSQHLIHVSDWLPTLLHAAGYDLGKLPASLDGINQWESISENVPTNRTEILLNNDPKENSSSIRVGDMKLLYAKTGYTVDCRNWYKPDGSKIEKSCQPTEEMDGRVDQSGNVLEGKVALEEILSEKEDLREKVVLEEKEVPIGRIFSSQNNNLNNFNLVHNFINRDVELAQEYPWSSVESYTYHHHSEELYRIFREIGRKHRRNKPLVISCGTPPANVSTNCLPWIQPCLFNITSDPCEFNNLASLMPDFTSKLMHKITEYEKNSIPPINKPVDDKGLPYHHGGNWVPWIKLEQNDLRGTIGIK